MAPPAMPDSLFAPYGAINAAGDPGPQARHRRQRPRWRCFYCVTPRAKAQTRSRRRGAVAVCP